jgi:hypothetical protein
MPRTHFPSFLVSSTLTTGTPAAALQSRTSCRRAVSASLLPARQSSAHSRTAAYRAHECGVNSLHPMGMHAHHEQAPGDGARGNSG